MLRADSAKQRPGRVSLIEAIGYISAMSFTFRQIEIFVEAAVDGNFRKTADRLGISQPAVSKQIRALEQSVGKTLFLRTRGTSATLSADGEAMLATAREMLAKQQQWHPTRIGHAPLHLKAITGDYLLDNLIKPALSEITRRFPDVSLEFQVSNERSRIFEQIRARQADLAVYTGDPPPQNLLNSEILSIIPCSLYAAPLIAQNLGNNLEAIENTPFVLPAVASTKSWVLGALDRAGIHPKRIAVRAQFGDVLAEMVRDGLGIGLLFDDHASARFGDQLRRVPVEIEPAYRIMIMGERAKAPKAQPCLDFLRQLASLPKVKQ
jgi:DNA-binding transcriptional LysR family regulator